MDRKVLINQLVLSYSPMSNYDFTVLKKEPILQRIIENSSLYIIGQRPDLCFDKITNDEKDGVLNFEIKQNNNPNILKCKLPIFQENIATDQTKEVTLHLNLKDKNGDFDISQLNDVNGIQFFQRDNDGEKFLVWFSPEKFLHNYWDGLIHADIKGDIFDFTRYKVHYVGQSTKQDIWQRLTGHEKLQDILSIEYPLNYGSLPTNEIVILLFEFQDNLQIQSFGPESSENDMVDNFMGRNMPEKRTIFLDAEKALINAMQPKYNDELFKNYPKSKDGLFKHNYDSVSYTIMDPITLVYDMGEIQGGLDFMGGDAIIIMDNKKMELFKK